MVSSMDRCAGYFREIILRSVETAQFAASGWTDLPPYTSPGRQITQGKATRSEKFAATTRDGREPNTLDSAEIQGDTCVAPYAATKALRILGLPLGPRGPKDQVPSVRN